MEDYGSLERNTADTLSPPYSCSHSKLVPFVIGCRSRTADGCKRLSLTKQLPTIDVVFVYRYVDLGERSNGGEVDSQVAIGEGPAPLKWKVFTAIVPPVNI